MTSASKSDALNRLDTLISSDLAPDSDSKHELPKFKDCEFVSTAIQHMGFHSKSYEVASFLMKNGLNYQFASSPSADSSRLKKLIYKGKF